MRAEWRGRSRSGVRSVTASTTRANSRALCVSMLVYSIYVADLENLEAKLELQLFEYRQKLYL